VTGMPYRDDLHPLRLAPRSYLVKGRGASARSRPTSRCWPDVPRSEEPAEAIARAETARRAQLAPPLRWSFSISPTRPAAGSSPPLRYCRRSRTPRPLAHVTGARSQLRSPRRRYQCPISTRSLLGDDRPRMGQRRPSLPAKPSSGMDLRRPGGRESFSCGVYIRRVAADERTR
jgi:hypothetical protein